MKHENFAVFILSHNRADNVKSYDAVKRAGYTGQIYILVDDLDDQVGEYKNRYGDEVIVFDKQEAVDSTDSCDNLNKHNSVVFARNENFRIAKDLGLEYFWQLDDDYTSFAWVIDNDGNYLSGARRIKKIDYVLDSCIDFLIESDAKSVAFVQGGDLMGGGTKTGYTVRKARQGQFIRKAMNSFLFATNKPVEFRGRVNDDVNLYVERGRQGDLFISIPRLRLDQPATQKASGGCTDVYLDLGTYVKTFYSVLVAPSCVKVSTMGTEHRRIHHKILWNYAVPKIISPVYRKASNE